MRARPDNSTNVPTLTRTNREINRNHHREKGVERVEDPSRGAGAEPLPGSKGRALGGVHGQSPWLAHVDGEIGLVEGVGAFVAVEADGSVRRGLFLG